MAECILERTNNPVPPPDDDMLPSWCKCGNCVLMETEEENVCCNKTTCITTYRYFYNICLDQQVLTVAMHQRCDIRADPISYSPESYRKAAYRQYILWIYKKPWIIKRSGIGNGAEAMCISALSLL